MLVDAQPSMASHPITTELPEVDHPAAASWQLADDFRHGIRLLLSVYPEGTIVVGSVRHVGLPAEPLDPLLYAADQLSSLSP